MGVSASIVFHPSRCCSQCAPIMQSIRETVTIVHTLGAAAGQFQPSVDQSHVLLDPKSVRDDDHQRRTQLIIHRRRSGFVLCHPRADPSQCPASSTLSL